MPVRLVGVGTLFLFEFFAAFLFIVAYLLILDGVVIIIIGLFFMMLC